MKTIDELVSEHILDGVPDTELRHVKWVRAFLVESDRGCVLVTQAILEKRMRCLILAHLMTYEYGVVELAAELLEERNNPLGSFKSCMEYAVRLELISGKTKQVLTKINDMRVEFAHYKVPRRSHIDLDRAKSIFGFLSEEQKAKAKHLMGYKLFADRSEGRKYFSATAIVLITAFDYQIHSIMHDSINWSNFIAKYQSQFSLRESKSQLTPSTATQ